MTSADSDDVLSVTSEGVTVEKSFEPEDFPVPAIAFTVRSEREDPATVRLVDSVPEDVSPENIGFHPKYGAEFWDVDGGGIVFERELAAGEEYTTVYGLRGDDGEHPEKFLTEPTLESVTPALGDESAGDANGSGPDSDETGEGEMDEDEGEMDEDESEIDEDKADETTNADEDIETVSIGPDPEEAALDLPESPEIADEDGGSLDLGDDAGVPDDGVGGPAAPDDGAGTAASERAPDGTLLETLADEIDAADPDDPEIVALRDALGMDLTRTTIEARIEHLQSAVSDLEAYTGALEEFLDENGDGQQVLDDVREQYDETAARLDGVEETAADASDSVGELEDRVDAEFEEIEAGMDELRTDVENLEAELDSISDDLSAVIEMRDRLTSALGGLGGEPSGEGDDDGDGSV